MLHALDGRSAETDDEGDTPSGFAAWRSFSFSSFSPRARKDTSTSIETTTTASEDEDKPRVEVDEALRKKREQAVLDALWKKKDQKEGTMWRKSSAVRKTSIALQFGVSRGLCDVLLALRGRGYPSEVVSEFGPKPGPRCRDSETLPLSLGEKRGTRRVDGVEGYDDALRRRRREDKLTHGLMSTQVAAELQHRAEKSSGKREARPREGGAASHRR